MPVNTRKGQVSDRGEIVTMFNEINKAQGWCVTGAEDISPEDIRRLTLDYEYAVHTNTSGQVDGAIFWTTKNTVEPMCPLLLVSPSKAVDTEKAMASVCLQMVESLLAKEHAYVNAKINSRDTNVGFLLKIGGEIVWEGSNNVEVPRHIRFPLSITVKHLEAILNS